MSTASNGIKGRLARKTRKLLRSPRAFFRDAAALHLARRVLPGRPAVAPVSAARPAVAARAKPVAGPAATAPRSAPALLGLALERLGGPFAGLAPYTLAASEKAGTSRMQVHAVEPADNAFATLLFMARGDEEAAAALLHEAASPELLAGFAPFGPRHLFAGLYTAFPTEGLIETVNRFDLAAKQGLGRFRNLVFIDPACQFARAARCCHTDTRLIVILSKAASLTVVPESEIDVLIVPAGHAAEGLRARRVLRYGAAPGAWPSAAVALRRAVREAGPKPLDVLLPVYGEGTYDPSLLEVDTRHTDGLIVLRGLDLADVTADTPAFEAFLGRVAPHVRSVALSESTFLRYRSAVEAIAAPADLARFLLLSLQDGARYAVRD